MWQPPSRIVPGRRRRDHLQGIRGLRVRARRPGRERPRRGLPGGPARQAGSTCRRRIRQAEALTLSAGAGGEPVDCADAEVDPWREPGVRGCRWRSGANRAPDRAERQLAPVVQRSSERIDHAVEPSVGDGQGAPVAQHDGRPPGPSPSAAPNRSACARPPRKPTISARTGRLSRADRPMRSPTEVTPASLAISTARPLTPVSVPGVRVGRRSATAARQP